MKYPRTYHLPWSDGISKEDRIMQGLSGFYNKEVVVTEKMDGENTTMTRDRCYARSIDSISHESRTWVRKLWSDIKYHIPESYRICGENLYAKHNIYYDNLLSYFYGFSIWDGKRCLSFDETVEWFSLLNIICVPVLYRGIFDEHKIREIIIDREKQEGYVVRVVEAFDINDFRFYVGKYVRRNHVNSDDHWMYQKIIPNKLIGV